MGCIELMKHEILLSNTSFKEGREFKRRNFGRFTRSNQDIKCSMFI